MNTARTKTGWHGAKTTQRAGATQAAVVQTSVAVATANASDLATAQALANSLKTQLNAAVVDIAANQALLNEIRAALVDKGIIKGAA